MPLAFIVVYAVVVGAAVGSFLNVCVYRWPAGLSITSPARSFCPNCKAPIRWYHNLPVVGWLALRGRCRDCDVRISPQYPLVELVTAMLWGAVALRHGFDLETVRGAVFLTMLLGIALTDARHMVIPDQFSLGGTAIGLLAALAPGGITILTAVIGAAAGYVFFWLVMYLGEKVFRRPALGLGDVHMMAMVGAFTGWAGVFLTTFLGSVLGVLFALFAVVLRGRYKAMESYLPFGVFLAMAGAIAYLWGPVIFTWYLRNFVL